MTVWEYLKTYGRMVIVDKDKQGRLQKAFFATPAIIANGKEKGTMIGGAVGGIVRAGDFRRLGIF